MGKEVPVDHLSTNVIQFQATGEDKVRNCIRKNYMSAGWCEYPQRFKYIKLWEITPS